MHCYQHSDAAANGLCKHCQKAICAHCAIDVEGAGLACSAACEGEVRDMQQILLKSKVIYRIGSKPSAFNSNVLTHLVMGSLFAGFGLFDLATGGGLWAFTTTLGLAFLFVGGYAWWRNRRVNMNF